MVRLKNRYLLVNILYPASLPASDTSLPHHIIFNQPSPPSLTASTLATAIRSSVALLYGDVGVGSIAGSLAVKYLSPATSTAIVRVARERVRVVWAGLAFLTSLEGRRCVVRVVRVSGTLRKAVGEAVRRARESVLKARREGGDGVLGMSGEGVGGEDEGAKDVEDVMKGIMDDEDVGDGSEDKDSDDGD